MRLGLLVVALWLVAVGVLAYRVAGHIRSGQRAVAVAQAGIKPASITDPGASDLLEPVRSNFAAARHELDNPLVAPVRVLPVLGRQVRSVRALAGAAEQVAIIGQATVSQARVALRAPHHTGPERAAAIKALADAVSLADARLSRVSLGPDNALLGLVRHRRDEFATRLSKVQAGIHRGATAAQAVSGLFAGPRHLLFLGANNAEMRSGSGMLLSATSLDLDQGAIAIGGLHDTTDLMLPPGAVGLTGDTADRWGFLGPNQEWRNLALTPRFDVTGALAAQMWTAKTGERVDGVIAVDVAAMHALLVATGPVSVGGRTVTADNVVPLLLHDQYNDVGTADSANSARREALGSIANGVLAAIQAGRYDPGRLASELAGIVSGRHVLVWSARPGEQDAWVASGVGGQLGADRFMVTVMNRGANKLDQFLGVSTDLAVAARPGQTVLTATVHLTNSTPPGQVPYVAGLGVDAAGPNEYYGYVQATLPLSATAVTVDGRNVADVSGRDGPTQMVAVLRKVVPGQTVDVAFSFTVPVAHGHLQVESAARMPAATLRVIGPSPSAVMSDEQRPRIVW